MAHIRVDFLSRSTFHGLDGTNRQEWPPSPLRILGALLAGAHALDRRSDRDRAVGAIQQLSRLAPPTIYLPASVSLDRPDTFTEKSAPPDTRIAAGSLTRFVDFTHLGLNTSSRTAKPMRGRLLADPSIVFDIGDALGEDAIAGLQTAASMIGYFGRSQDHAVVAVSNTAPDLGRLEEYAPEPHPAGRQRGWTETSVDWFEARHRAIMIDAGSQIPSEAGAFAPLRYAPRRPVRTDRNVTNAGDGLSAVMFTHGIRLGDIPRELTKVENPDPSAALIPLVNYNRPRIKCYGIAVSGPLPARLATVERVRKSLTPLTTDDAGEESRLFYQYGSMPPSDRWISATPIRAFGHRLILQRALESEIGAEVQIEEADTRPIDGWQQRLADTDLVDGLSQWFVRFRTGSPSPAPMMVGACRELGFGLCVPIPKRGTQ